MIDIHEIERVAGRAAEADDMELFIKAATLLELYQIRLYLSAEIGEQKRIREEQKRIGETLGTLRRI